MIQQVMLYAIGSAAMFGMAALGLEWLAALRGWPRRPVWIAALLVSVLLPLCMIQRAEPARAAVAMPAPAPALRSESPLVVLPAPRPIDPSNAPQAEVSLRALPPALQRDDWQPPQLADRTLLQAWGIASVLGAFYLICAHLRLRRRIEGWQRATLLGRPVLVSEAMGPALVGVLRPQLVVPRWLFDEPVTTQSLILEHEQQHIAARDALLIRAGLLLLAALPWNLPLWWQWRRLRQAIELDCDARVLRAGAEPRAYGEVLLAVTGRAARMSSTALAMSEPVSALERRIQSLLPDPVRHGAWQVSGAVVLLAAGIGAAVAMNAPVIPAREAPTAATAQAFATPASPAAPAQPSLLKVEESPPAQLVAKPAAAFPGERVAAPAIAAAAAAQPVQVAPSGLTELPQAAAPSQDLAQVRDYDPVIAATWMKRPDSYVLQILLDRSVPRKGTDATAADTPAATAPIEAQQTGIAAEALNELLPDQSRVPPSQTTGENRSQYFIGNTIANLRGLDPTFCGRLLTMVDGRRSPPGGGPAPPAQLPFLMNQPYPPKFKESRVDVWLLKSDGTQIVPTTYSCGAGPRVRTVDLLYEFATADGEQAVAAAIRVDDRFYIEKLQLPVRQ